MEKTFEKRIKTIEDPGDKQIRAIRNQGAIKTIKKYDYSDKESPLILKEKEIFNKFANEKINERTELDNKSDTGNLMYRY